MKLALFASPDFALPSYRALSASRHTLAVVVTRPDAPKGRNLKLAPTPVAEAAAADGRPVLKPGKLNRAFIDELSTYGVDALVVVAYGRLIGPTLLSTYRERVLNLHPSLLPLLRGASPIQTAIFEGDAVSGVSVMHLVDELDAGDIILQRPFPLPPRIDVAELHDRLAGLGADLLIEALDRVEAGAAPRIPQDSACATFSKPIDKAMGRIDWALDCDTLDRHVRAFHLWPGSFTTLDGALLRLHRAEPVVPGAECPSGVPPLHPAGVTEPRPRLSVQKAGRSGGSMTRKRGCMGVEPPDLAVEPGRVLAADETGILVACGRGALRVLELQPEARKRMAVAAFLRGRPVVTGTQLS